MREELNGTQIEPDFESLFNGRREQLDLWRKVGPNEFHFTDGTLVTYGSQGFALLYYAERAFGNFILRLQFRLSDPARDNSGVFVRFRDPLLPPTPEVLARDEFSDIPENPAWVAVYSGFEVQIDERARGNKRKGERDGLDKNRTGAIYKIPTGQDGEPRLQEFMPAPPLQATVWNDLEIEVAGDTYAVRLNDHQTTRFVNTDRSRGQAPSSDPNSGYIGLQSYRNSQVSFRRIRIRNAAGSPR